ncbi:MAG: hypothetical protein GX620_07105 [Chloroflexi bacterium]|nr:hypothetical protein [Chloroflexota bacterium]
MKQTVSIRAMAYLAFLIAMLGIALWSASSFERGVLVLPAGGPGEELTFYPVTGAYDRSLRVSIHPSVRQAPVVFTTGGSVPTLTVGTLYERPILIDSRAPGVTVVRAREFINGVAGPVTNASYVIGVESALPVISVIADPVDLWDADKGILTNTWQRGPEWEPTVHITYIDEGDGFNVPGGLRIDGLERFDAPKQSFRLYFRAEHGHSRLEYPLFFGHPHQEAQSYKRVLLQAGGHTGRWTLIGHQLISDVATDLGCHTTQGRPVLLFLNGERQGIYRLSERVDRFFLTDNLGIESADVIRHDDVKEGDDRHWEALLEWVSTHPLDDADNWTYVQSLLDVEDFTTFAVLQMYFGFPVNDFTVARPRIVGGRWFWIYGDNDLDPTLNVDLESPLLSPCGRSDDLALLLCNMLDNSDYRAYFAARAADLLNVQLESSTMEERVARLAADLRPEIEHEVGRWPVYTDWELNVAVLRDYVEGRPDRLRQQIADSLGLHGTVQLTATFPAEGGMIYINGAKAAASPWHGEYFAGSELQLIAVPTRGYVFDGWRHGDTVEPTTLMTVTLDSPRSLTAQFAPAVGDDLVARPNDVIINEYWINDDGTRYATLNQRPIEGDWVELLVNRDRVDLRGWRITDNDTKVGTDEGSIILSSLDVLKAVPGGTIILIITTESDSNSTYFPQDDLDITDRRLIFYVGNGNLDVTTDPGFNIGTGDDSLALLAPGLGEGFADDIGIDFVAEGTRVTPYSFGILADGVVFENPFQHLGSDDGAIFIGNVNNDDGAENWIVDPPATQTGDATGLGAANILTPGALNHMQGGSLLHSEFLWLSVGAAIVGTAFLHLRLRRS